MALWLLVPIKSLDDGKRRLKPVLADEARRQLNEFFLRRVMTVACQFPGRGRTAVISGCDGVLRLAASCGVHTIKQTGGPGLNAAAEQGVGRLRELGATRILVMAGDLPTIRPSDIREVSDAGAPRQIVICPDKHRTGTNALLVCADTPMQFRFGDDSCAEHGRAAARTGAAPLVHFNARLALDIDVPQDLTAWLDTQKSDHRRRPAENAGPAGRFCDKLLTDLEVLVGAPRFELGTPSPPD
jgi:2-phospho-L-lactate guanylyltransferase